MEVSACEAFSEIKKSAIKKPRRIKELNSKISSSRQNYCTFAVHKG